MANGGEPDGVSVADEQLGPKKRLELADGMGLLPASDGRPPLGRLCHAKPGGLPIELRSKFDEGLGGFTAGKVTIHHL